MFLLGYNIDPLLDLSVAVTLVDNIEWLDEQMGWIGANKHELVSTRMAPTGLNFWDPRLSRPYKPYLALNIVSETPISIKGEGKR